MKTRTTCTTFTSHVKARSKFVFTAAQALSRRLRRAVKSLEVELVFEPAAMLKASREAFPGEPPFISRPHPIIHETSAPRSLLRASA